MTTDFSQKLKTTVYFFLFSTVSDRLRLIFILFAAIDEDGSLDLGDDGLTITVYDERGDTTHTSLGEVSFTVVGDVTVTLVVISPETQEQQAYSVSCIQVLL